MIYLKEYPVIVIKMQTHVIITYFTLVRVSQCIFFQLFPGDNSISTQCFTISGSTLLKHPCFQIESTEKYFQEFLNKHQTKHKIPLVLFIDMEFRVAVYVAVYVAVVVIVCFLALHFFFLS